MGKTEFIHTWKWTNLSAADVAEHCSVSTISPHLWYFSLKIKLHYTVRSRYSIQDILGLPTPVQKSVLSEATEMNKASSSDSNRKFVSC